jgi:hypothetical protein
VIWELRSSQRRCCWWWFKSNGMSGHFEGVKHYNWSSWPKGGISTTLLPNYTHRLTSYRQGKTLQKTGIFLFFSEDCSPRIGYLIQNRVTRVTFQIHKNAFQAQSNGTESESLIIINFTRWERHSRFQESAAMLTRSALFWVITRRRVVILKGADLRKDTKQ